MRNLPFMTRTYIHRTGSTALVLRTPTRAVHCCAVLSNSAQSQTLPASSCMLRW